MQCNDHFSYQYLLKIFRCATCVDGAEQGQAGYCNKKISKPRRISYGAKPKRHYGRPTAAENWGLCSMNCNPIPSDMRHNKIQVRTRIYEYMYLFKNKREGSTKNCNFHLLSKQKICFTRVR